ncbi:MAG: helix-turn-helix domain-containing protein [bacterium]|nr:helix-turn-helix domain-containing protein [bacterium]MDY6005081.1 helix-turn-helix domain-containing protein [Parabacteroides sp.]
MEVLSIIIWFWESAGNKNANAMKSEMMHLDHPIVSRTRLSDEVLWTRLNVKMEEEQSWRKPDLTICSLARSLGTNRTRLSQLIHKQGYSSFQAYVCEFRINAFLELLPINQTLNVQGLFYEVGFKSKVTALRYFRQRTGMTPTEYFKNVILKPNR